MSRGNLEEDVRGMVILTFSMIIGILLFMGVGIVVNYMNGPFLADRDLMNTFFYIVLAFTFLLVVVARITYIRKIASLKEAALPADEKVSDFRAISITHMALCELPAIFSLICFLLFGNYLFLIPVVIGVAEMIIQFPTREKLEEVADTGSV